ncbi:MAG: hypothetical protein N3E45_10825 [Oscillatoriaceae bacterium SKW80]|nr:hypothetical protein [Oscillatoriaceae bacterium SKYG93]MCX8121305.1 hypothetical protein [Oscillatoriaceae bacterium SKW80]MDW8453361.1 hypothetical protein [Oscillatoriaceae cyanobacterium SKYGB_i_bin93]HIK26715.1 hypothetical protein [Oscillatoriaceae cyanobacterium M7585_C2015_266]
MNVISKTILRLNQPAIINPITTTQFSVSKRTIEAMQRLIAIITEIRSPHGGWHQHLPPTPENLAPYVAEEACEVLDAWQNDNIEINSTKKIKKSQYILIEDLIPKLLWYLVKSSQEIMQLLTGVKARCCLPQTEAKSGTLRLAVILEIDTGDERLSIDIATLQPLKKPLPEEATIQIFSKFEPITAKQYIQQLREQILAASPEISIFLETTYVEILKPCSNWKKASVKITLAFEFIDIKNNKISPVANTEFQEKTYIIFNDSEFLEKNYQSLVYEKLIVTKNAANKKINQIIAAACSLADIQAEQQKKQWQWQEIMQRMLWQIVSSSYEIMQLTGGVEAKVLQQQQNWKIGTLRCKNILRLEAKELNLNWDLSSGEKVYKNMSKNIEIIAPTAIVQSSSIRLLQEAIPAHTLLKKLKRQIISIIPEIEHFIKGTNIEWLTCEGDWQPASIQLRLALEFIP